MRGEATVVIGASADQLWRMVADVPRMGEWSPETYRCEWVPPATGPEIGARFRGWNRRGPFRWRTTPRVVAAEPGREFAFSTMLFGLQMTRWRYAFEPVDGGTRVTESYETHELASWMRWRIAELLVGMNQTLARLKAAAEAKP